MLRFAAGGNGIQRKGSRRTQQESRKTPNTCFFESKCRIDYTNAEFNAAVMVCKAGSLEKNLMFCEKSMSQRSLEGCRSRVRPFAAGHLAGTALEVNQHVAATAALLPLQIQLDLFLAYSECVQVQATTL